MIGFFDCDAGFGRAMVPPMRYAATAGELVEEMEFCGIGEVLVYHAARLWQLSELYPFQFEGGGDEQVKSAEAAQLVRAAGEAERRGLEVLGQIIEAL